MIERWWREQRQSFEALLGESVVSWRGQEMAVRDDPPEFAPTADARCWQFRFLTLVLGGVAPACVHGYQNDDQWGLMLEAADDDGRDDETDGIYRFRSVPELPTGPIQRSAVRLSERATLMWSPLSSAATT